MSLPRFTVYILFTVLLHSCTVVSNTKQSDCNLEGNECADGFQCTLGEEDQYQCVPSNFNNMMSTTMMNAGEMNAGMMNAGEMSAGEMSAGMMNAGEMSAGTMNTEGGNDEAQEMRAGAMSGGSQTSGGAMTGGREGTDATPGQ